MVFVPNLNTNNTYGKTLEEALYMAQDLIAMYILEDLEAINKNGAINLKISEKSG